MKFLKKAKLFWVSNMSNQCCFINTLYFWESHVHRSAFHGMMSWAMRRHYLTMCPCFSCRWLLTRYFGYTDLCAVLTDKLHGFYAAQCIETCVMETVELRRVCFVARMIPLSFFLYFLLHAGLFTLLSVGQSEHALAATFTGSTFIFALFMHWRQTSLNLQWGAEINILEQHKPNSKLSNWGIFSSCTI